MSRWNIIVLLTVFVSTWRFENPCGNYLQRDIQFEIQGIQFYSEGIHLNLRGITKRGLDTTWYGTNDTAADDLSLIILVINSTDLNYIHLIILLFSQHKVSKRAFGSVFERGSKLEARSPTCYRSLLSLCAVHGGKCSFDHFEREQFFLTLSVLIVAKIQSKTLPKNIKFCFCKT